MTLGSIYCVWHSILIVILLFPVQVVARVNGFHLKKYFQHDDQNVVSENDMNTEVWNSATITCRGGS